MEARRQPEPATLAELVKLSNAADWEGCDVRQFSRASFEKLASLGKAEAYENDSNGEKPPPVNITSLKMKSAMPGCV